MKRSGFLVLAAWAASLWLYAFAADATLSVIDESLAMALGGDVLSGLRNGVALFVVYATLPALLVTIFVPQLPKLVLLPPVFFVLWTALGAPPLPATARGSLPMLALSAAQLLLAANALFLVRRRHVRWRLVAEQLPVVGHLWLRTILALVLTLFVGAAATAGLAAAAVVSYLEGVTGGYMQFGWSGIAMRETVLERDGKTVRLVATAHIAEPGFYREIRRNIPGDALVFVEGVTDRKGRLGGFSQHAAAQALGLSTQDVFNELLPVPEEVDEAGVDDDAGKPGPGSDAPHVVRADVDTEVFSDRAVEYLQDVDKVMQSASLGSAMAELSAFSRKYTETETQAIFGEIVGRRNLNLLEAFDRLAGNYATVVIPWGAMHMPGLEQGLADRHFRVVSTRSVPMARFSTILNRFGRESGATPQPAQHAERGGE